MSTSKISELTNLGTAPASDDSLVIVDTSAGETKKVSFSDLNKHPDNVKATFGASDDLQIYHDGSNSYITEAGTGDLKIRSNKIRMEAPDSQNMIIVTEDAGVQAFYNGTQRLAVTNTGIDVTGTVTADGLTVDGTTSFQQKVVFDNNDELRWKDSGGTERTALVLDGSNDLNLGTSAGGNLKFYNGSSYTERARLDSSGNWLVGNTIANPASGFSNQRGFGYTNSTGKVEIATTANDAAIEIGKNNATDGALAIFRKQGTVVGSIGSLSGNAYIAGASKGIRFGSVAIIPSTTAGLNSDATHDIGDASVRFKNLYLSGGVYLGGTGAANLLDDYETGTWTPVYIPSGGSFTSITMDTPDCQYIKIGNMVTVSGIIRTDEVTIGAATGNVLISGLPFTANGWGACSIGRAQDFAGDVPMAGYVGGNSSNINLYYRTTANGSTTALSISDLQTGTVANANYIFIECTYYTTA